MYVDCANSFGYDRCASQTFADQCVMGLIEVKYDDSGEICMLAPVSIQKGELCICNLCDGWGMIDTFRAVVSSSSITNQPKYSALSGCSKRSGCGTGLVWTTVIPSNSVFRLMAGAVRSSASTVIK